MVFVAVAYLFSPLAINSMRGPEYWLRVNSVEVAHTTANVSPPMVVNRSIVRPFLAGWSVIIRRQETAGWIVACAAHGGGDYRVDAALPENLTLDWWTDGQCKTLAPGAYQATTIWEIHPKGGVTKRLVVESNVFEVTS
jgi:hypothetical protein